jgi:hypothetical protein
VSGAVAERWPIGTNDSGQTEWSAGLMTPYVPGINCLKCGRFVGRDGWIGIDHFEMSSEIAYVEGECSRCEAADHEANPERYGQTQQEVPSHVD